MKGFALALAAFGAFTFTAPALDFQTGDRVCVIGNALAENLQREGWLETLLQVRFPERSLSFRNLGAPGEILDLRLKPERLKLMDGWLTKLGADVVFAFYGTNESFAGAEGVAAFSERVDEFLIHLLSQPYNGQSGPRIVLFSPLGHSAKPDFNQRLAPYAAAMEAAARGRGVEFVDLFSLTKSFNPPLSTDGVELTEQGRAIVAGLIDRALFGDAPSRTGDVYGRVQPVVARKDQFWREQYAAFADQPGIKLPRDLAGQLDPAIWAAAK